MQGLIEKAQKVHKAGDFRTAETLYKRFLEVHPEQAHVLYLMGTCQLQMDQAGIAERFLLRSLKLDPDYVPALSNLGVAYRQLGRVTQAKESLKKAIAVAETAALITDEDKKSFADALSNLGAVLHSCGDNTEAVGYLERAVGVWPNQNVAQWNLGLAHLKMGNWAKGWEGYDWGYRSGERKVSGHVNTCKEWLGEDLQHKTIIVWGEQGLGDEIQFASCLPDLEADRIILDAHPRLAPIFARSFPDIEVVGKRKDLRSLWALGSGADYHVPIGSLPRFYRNKLEDFPGTPYILPEPEKVAEWREQLGNEVVIGISWRGGKNTNVGSGDGPRSIPLVDWPFLAPIPGVKWVSLQYGPHYPELERFNESRGMEIAHHEWAMEDYNEGCNLNAACDLIITVQTALTHRSGALGVPCWVMVPKSATWRYVDGEALPWYNSVRQFHQEKDWHWGEVLETVGKELTKFLRERGIGA